MVSKRNGTETSKFGSPGRINHDSSKFYDSRLYEGLPTEKENITFIENKINKKSMNRIFCKSSDNMEELPDNSIHLMVTSPPYNVGKEYDKNLSLNEGNGVFHSEMYINNVPIIISAGSMINTNFV